MARLKIPFPRPKVGEGSGDLARDLLEIERAVNGIQGGGGIAGALVVDPLGNGDYLSLLDALSFISGTGLTGWVIFVRGQTFETGNINFTDSDLTLIGMGGDSGVFDAGSHNFTFTQTVRTFGLQMGAHNLQFADAWITAGSVAADNFLGADNIYGNNSDFVAGSSSITVDGSFHMNGGFLSAPLVECLGEGIFSGIDIFGAMQIDFESRGYLSGWMNSSVEIIGFDGVNFALTMVGNTTTLTISTNKNVGTLTTTSSGNRLVVNGDRNKVLCG